MANNKKPGGKHAVQAAKSYNAAQRRLAEKNRKKATSQASANRAAQQGEPGPLGD